MKNKITDLNNHLFAQLERLSEEGMSDDAIATEVHRTEAIVKVADQIIAAGALHIKATQLVAEHGVTVQNALFGVTGLQQALTDEARK